ncbi:MAG: efflux RND transporter periplasmic adaptor subunit [Bacteroidia bacterium]|nr:efflux RND transporter periplasmic adaptor subunit [Bacteroidia bacterium]
MNKRSIPLALFVVLLFSCQSRVADKTEVLYVKTEVIKYNDSETTINFPGKVKAGSHSELSFRVSGPIKVIHAQAGNKVKKGEILAEIDSRDYLLQLEATEAEYYKVKGEAERVIALYKKNSVTENDYQKAVYGLQQITAKYNSHKNALQDTKLIAPYNGYVNKIHYQENETIGAGMPVISMMGSDNLKIEIAVPSQEYLKKESFISFDCSSELYPDKTFPLKLSGIDPKANLNQLHTVFLDVQSKEGNKLLTPGMIVNVYVKQKETEMSGVKIPISSVIHQEGKTYVWKINNNESTAHKQEIELEKIFEGGYVSVICGLHSNDTIIVAGVQSVKEGQKVKPIQKESPTNAGGIL